MPRRANSQFLIRANHNRTVQAAVPDQTQAQAAAAVTRLQQAMPHTPVAGHLELELRRTPERDPRTVQLSVRYVTLTLAPPANHPQQKELQPVQLQVILATEDQPPPDAEPVSWLLLTSLPVTCLADAAQCLRWYSYRWLIERYHYVLKSGCRLEHLQLETKERLHKALATYSIVAWRLLWLTYLSRSHPHTPADTVLEPHEWQSLYCTIHRSPLPPTAPPSLNTCIRWIAQLGGFLGRKRDGDPGVKTLWLGLRRLHDIAQTFSFLHFSSCCQLGFC